MGRDTMQIREDLLAWAGLHRGKNINEKAMPRFHEIIDRLEQVAQETQCMDKQKPNKQQPTRSVTISWTGLSGDRRTFVSTDDDEVKAKYDLLFAKYLKGEIRSVTLDME